MPRPTAYVICATPRSGSTLLCTLLKATGIAGDPNSYFRPDDVAEWALEWGLPSADHCFGSAYLNAMRHAGRGRTPLFGLRLMAENIPDASDCLARCFAQQRDDAARFNAAFGITCYIHLTRADKVAQAVSYVKARQSGLWHQAPDGTDLERIGTPQTPKYDPDAITRQINALALAEAAWSEWFAAQAITPLRLTYSALATDPQGAVARVLTHLNLDPARAGALEPRTATLRDQQSAEWCARYKSQTGNFG